MLAKVCLKRFRFVLYAALFFLITLHITDRTNSGLIATICIWFALPLAFIAFVWWIYACIRDIVRFFKSGAVPEDAQDTVQWLDELHLLDDAAVAEQVVQSAVRKGYGRRRIGGAGRLDLLAHRSRIDTLWQRVRLVETLLDLDGFLLGR